MKTGPITVTIHAKRRIWFWPAFYFFRACVLIGMDADRAASLVTRLGYRLTLDEQ